MLSSTLCKISCQWSWDFLTLLTTVYLEMARSHFEAHSLERITFACRLGTEEAGGEGQVWPIISYTCSEYKCAAKKGLKYKCRGRGDECFYLPEDAVYCTAQEALPGFRRKEFGSQYCHEFIKVHLSVTCVKKRTLQSYKKKILISIVRRPLQSTQQLSIWWIKNNTAFVINAFSTC